MDLATIIGKCKDLTVDNFPNDMPSLEKIQTENDLTLEEFNVLVLELMNRKGKI
jgi:hypothetical protein